MLALILLCLTFCLQPNQPFDSSVLSYQDVKQESITLPSGDRLLVAWQATFSLDDLDIDRVSFFSKLKIITKLDIENGLVVHLVGRSK